MPKVEIKTGGCRGCSMCVERCPVDVFEQVKSSATANLIATVSRPDDCMGCFACYYICPSQCIDISEVEIQRPFYRFDDNIPFVERFLGIGKKSESLTQEEWEEAYHDVSMTLVSLARAIESIVGRGIGAVGRRAGIAAAQHIPEVFEEEELAKRLERLQQRFRHSFDFSFDIKNGEIQFTFMPCSLFKIVEDKMPQEKIGETALCRLFHEFLAGLIRAYDDSNYRCISVTVEPSDKKCLLALQKI